MKERRILLLHGIRSDGSRDVAELGNRLEMRGHAVELVELEMTRILTSRNSALTRRNLEILRLVARPGDHLLAHSNGARLGWYAMQTGFVFGHVFLFGPALDSNVVFPVGSYGTVDVWHNRWDVPVWLGSMRPWHSWGAMGTRGYRGISPQVRSHQVRGFRRLGHSHYFVQPHVEACADRVHGVLSGSGRMEGHA